MALALYRKYRPASFAEVVGQEHVTDPLSTALAAGRINHAYLFSGPRGCGKTSSARILARSLNCEAGPTPDPCGECPSCVSLAPGGPGSIDVTELDAASHGGVDDTRELRDRAFFAPAQSRYRVFVVDEAHMITTQGFNALLKIVEEPPEHLVFVFATTEPEKVLPTIRSRTHHYPFRLIPPGTLRKLMEGICAEEGVTVAPAVYPLVVRAGGGSARDSLSVLDQLLAGAGPDGVTYDRAVALLGVTDIALIDDIVDALAAGDRSAVFETVDRLVEAGHDPRRFASDLLQRLRDVLLLQAVPEAAGRGLVDVADDELARIVEQADRIGAATLTRYCEILHSGLIEMRGATAPRLLLELLCARMLLPAATVAEPGLLERLERLERRNDIATGPEPAPREQPAPEHSVQRRDQTPGGPEPQRPAGAAGRGTELDAAAVRRVWSEVLAAVRTRSRSIEAMLVNTTVRAVDGDTLVLGIGAPSLARRLSESRNADVVCAALHDVLGVRWTVRCESGDTPADPPRAAAVAPAPPRPAQPVDRPTPQPGPVVPPVDEEPLPPEPPDDEPPDDRYAGDPTADPAVPDDGPQPERDGPEEVALRLLSSTFGAQRLDPSQQLTPPSGG